MRPALIVACVLALLATRTSAQAPASPPPPLTLAVQRVPASSPMLSAHGLSFAAALQLDPTLPDSTTLARQRIARRVLAAGLGFTLAAAITPIYVLPQRRSCRPGDPRNGVAPLKGAAVVGGIGIAMAIGGGAWYGVEAHAHGLRATRRERWIAAAVGAVTFTLGQAALAGVFFFDQVCHT